MTDTIATTLTRDELRDLFREVLEEHHELIGQPIDTTAARDELRADATFVRKLRRAFDGAASKVGYAVLMALVVALGSVVVAGLAAKTGIKIGTQ